MYPFQVLSPFRQAEKLTLLKEPNPLLISRVGLAIAVGGAALFGVDKVMLDFMSDQVAISELTLTVGAGSGTAIGSFVSSRLM